MALRDLPYAEYRTVVLVGGVSSTMTAALPAAWDRVVRTRRGILRSKDLRIDRMVHVDSALSDDELVQRAAERSPSELPQVLVAGDRIALAVPHGRFDGAGSLALVHDLLDAAAGAPLPPEPPVERWPVLRAARGVDATAVREFVARRRRLQQTDAVAPVPTAEQAANRTGRLRTLWLDAGDLAALRRYRPVEATGRATLNSRLCSAVVAALRAVHSGERDQRVRVPADLRPRVSGRSVRGNFICGDPVGTLLSDDWSPWSLPARFAELAGPSGVVSLATGYPRHLAGKLLRRGAAHHAVNISLTASPRPMPDGWQPTSLAVTSVGRWPSPTFVFVWAVGDRVAVSLWDESGLFDVDGFEGALRGVIAERAMKRGDLALVEEPARRRGVDVSALDDPSGRA